jgi:hypothetical protein
MDVVSGVWFSGMRRTSFGASYGGVMKLHFGRETPGDFTCKLILADIRIVR